MNSSEILSLVPDSQKVTLQKFLKSTTITSGQTSKDPVFILSMLIILPHNVFLYPSVPSLPFTIGFIHGTFPTLIYTRDPHDPDWLKSSSVLAHFSYYEYGTYKYMLRDTVLFGLILPQETRRLIKKHLRNMKDACVLIQDIGDEYA